MFRTPSYNAAARSVQVCRLIHPSLVLSNSVKCWIFDFAFLYSLFCAPSDTQYTRLYLSSVYGVCIAGKGNLSEALDLLDKFLLFICTKNSILDSERTKRNRMRIIIIYYYYWRMKIQKRNLDANTNGFGVRRVMDPTKWIIEHWEWTTAARWLHTVRMVLFSGTHRCIQLCSVQIIIINTAQMLRSTDETEDA